MRKREVVSGDVAPLLRRVSDRVGSEADPIPPNPFIEHPAEYNPLWGGDQWKFTFRNGRGASVIRHSGSYGGPAGLWELAVLDADGHLDYTTPITSDVEGRLTEDNVRELLRAIAELEAVS